jgi:hypothetical protein
MELVKREDHYALYNEDGHKIAATLDGCNSKLSKENCDEIFGVVNVEKLADESTIDDYDIFDYNDGYGNRFCFNNSHKVIDVYMKGFNKAMELNKDKLFTVEDIQNILESDEDLIYQTVDEQGNVQFILDEEVLINSLQQPTEIEVEIETIEYGLGNNEDGKPVFETRNLLDKNGCLILKKK